MWHVDMMWSHLSILAKRGAKGQRSTARDAGHPPAINRYEHGKRPAPMMRRDTRHKPAPSTKTTTHTPNSHTLALFKTRLAVNQ